jgi:hypothetical protein
LQRDRALVERPQQHEPSVDLEKARVVQTIRGRAVRDAVAVANYSERFLD